MLYKEDNQIEREHYYGDAVRIILMLAGLIMMVMLPFFSGLIHAPLIFSILAILALALFSGFLNPKTLWILSVNLFISVIGCGIFEYYAVHSYLSLPQNVTLNVAFLWVNQILAVLFFISIYLSSKSLRGKVLAPKN